MCVCLCGYVYVPMCIKINYLQFFRSMDEL